MVHVWAAERQRKRRAVLDALYAPRALLAEAGRGTARAARAWAATEGAQVIGWTPPCAKVSRRAITKRASRALRYRVAKASTRSAVRALTGAIQQHRPALVLGEQVPGVRTHQEGCWSVIVNAIAELPYAWYTCECDAVNLGSPCHRNRVALAGVRLDCARPQQTRQHIGQRWHCKVPQCEGVYLPGEGCNVCHMHDPSGDR
jgi:site-specific DNA-cytosine methylase